jgi:hypothetical protein
MNVGQKTYQKVNFFLCVEKVNSILKKEKTFSTMQVTINATKLSAMISIKLFISKFFYLKFFNLE